MYQRIIRDEVNKTLRKLNERKRAESVGEATDSLRKAGTTSGEWLVRMYNVCGLEVGRHSPII